MFNHQFSVIGTKTDEENSRFFVEIESNKHLYSIETNDKAIFALLDKATRTFSQDIQAKQLYTICKEHKRQIKIWEIGTAKSISISVCFQTQRMERYVSRKKRF